MQEIKAGVVVGGGEGLTQKGKHRPKGGFAPFGRAEGEEVGFGEFALEGKAELEEAEPVETAEEPGSLPFPVGAGAAFFFRPRASRGASPKRRNCS